LARSWTAIAAVLLLVAPGIAWAGDIDGRPVRGVVEVFTSQGCSACGTSTGVLQFLAADRGIAAVAYHVDYWDYLGWRDRLATSRNTERQQAYGKLFDSGGLVTPQVVVNGRHAGEGWHRADIDRWLTVSPLPNKPPVPAPTLRRVDDRLLVSALDARPAANAAPLALILVTFAKDTRTRILDGENKDLTVSNHRAVVDWRAVGLLESGNELEVEIPIRLLSSGSVPLAGSLALLQAMPEGEGPGEIVAASVIDF